MNFNVMAVDVSNFLLKILSFLLPTENPLDRFKSDQAHELCHEKIVFFFAYVKNEWSTGEEIRCVFYDI